jgi:ATP-dependent 26S proteasome regulatory subunit
MKDNHYIQQVVIRNDSGMEVHTNVADVVKIGTFVYRTKRINNTTDYDNLQLTREQYDAAKTYIHNDKIMVSKYSGSIPITKTIEIEILDNNPIDPTDDVIETIIQTLIDQYLNLGQIVKIIHSDKEFRLFVKSLGSSSLARIDHITDITFLQEKKSDITCPKTVSYMEIFIVGCRGLHPTSRLPLIIKKSLLNADISKIIPPTFFHDDTITYKTEDFEFMFNIVIPLHNDLDECEHLYCMDETTTIDWGSKTSNALVVGDEVRMATQVDIIIYGSMQYLCGQSKRESDVLIPCKDITSYIRATNSILSYDQVLKYQDKNHMIIMKVASINPQTRACDAYVMDDKTKLIFHTEKSRFIIVDDVHPFDIKSITFKVFSLKKNGVGETLSNNHLSIDKDELIAIIRSSFPKITALKHNMTIIYHNHAISITVNDMQFVNQNHTKNELPIRGTVNDDTIINLNTIDDFISFTSKQSQVVTNDVIAELDKHVGGINDKLKTVIRNICLSRGELRKEFLARGLKPIRGIILHGPPGTGKTTLARQLGKLLGCEHIQFVAGPEVFDKLLGETEKNIRAMFEPARNDWAKLGDKSPLYMVIIDEIDAMIPSRSDNSNIRVDNRVVNQFIYELDGLHEYNNLICIGITNRLELLDPAATRSGRLEIHVKMDVPDKKARRHIFNIHTEILRKSDRIDDINFDKLVDMTANHTGADIENIVKMASGYSLDRMYQTKDSVIDKITENDLIKAFQEIFVQENEDSIYDNMYI